MKKKVLIFILVLFSFSVNAEEYICSGDVSKFSNNESNATIQTKSYERVNNFFIRHSQYGKSKFNIFTETDFILILTQEDPIGTIFVTMIDKQNKKFLEHFIHSTSNEYLSGLLGDCIIK